jgi:DNA-binding PadR family transcriptional regulator
MSRAERGTTKPLTGTTFYVLLALADRERYGLDIAEEVAKRTDGEVLLGPGTLYNTIKRMLADGQIAETAPRGRGEAGERDPRRRYYRITPAGRVTLAAEAGRLEVLVSAARAKHVLPSS